ncbi:hypothetical protein VFMJ11_1556 [Aliivibrio fischeri MJ11]|uniref:Uncharacterized protein n=2 Tax=Aliivibrio fischeri TaxID=668 RepID=B5FEL0_ALIFM|nr:hypothetical protein VFMJ11_1556 [Aliivibrio fischeri MJ11]
MSEFPKTRYLKYYFMKNQSTNKNTSTIKKSIHSLGEYLQLADWTFSLILAFIFKTLIFIFLIFISLASIYFEFLNIFKYQNILSDVSTAEIVFFISFLLLLKRYYTYSKQTSLRWWNIIITPFLWHGKFILTNLVFACFLLLLYSFEYKTIQSLILQNKNISQFLSLASILLSLYISVPSRSFIINQEIIQLNVEKTNKPEEIKTEKGFENAL